jgi:hypothetical protein
MHESIYCQRGGKSDWSATRLLSGYKSGDQLPVGPDGPLNFTGEMVLRDHFAAYPELTALWKVADSLAKVDDWPDLYDIDQLKQNKVPLYSATYIDDMYVDFDFAQETAKTIRGAKTFITNMMYHDALRSRTDEVFKNLFALRDDSID